MLKSLSIFTGNANRALADEICKFVEIPLGRADVTHFSDGEIYVEIGENVRGVNCFVVQPTCSPPNQALMELLIMIDALKRASAGSIVAIIPYFGYEKHGDPALDPIGEPGCRAEQPVHLLEVDEWLLRLGANQGLEELGRQRHGGTLTRKRIEARYRASFVTT